MSSEPSNVPLTKKLGIGDDTVFVVLHAPAGFNAVLGPVGGAVRQQHLMPPVDVVVTFHTRRADLVREWPSLTEAAAPDGAVWVAWPKKTSGVASEITEDVLRAELLRTGWVDNKVCSIDTTWSALRFVLRKDQRGPRRR